MAGMKAFEEAPYIRIGFIRKVYALLGISLLITVGIIAIPMASSSVANWFEENIWLFFTALVLALIFEIMVFCCIGMARRVPINYLLLVGFVVCESIMLAYICSATEPEIVFIAAGMTAGLVCGLTLFAMFTKQDFTVCLSAIALLVIALLMFGLFALIFNSRILQIVYCSLGIIVFGIYLIIDTQLIMGNKRYKLSPDDYVIGVLILYIDIVMIFIYILSLLGSIN